MYCNSRVIALLSAVGLCLLACVSPSAAQSSGSRGGVLQGAKTDSEMPMLQHDAVQNYITVEGSAELRVPPTQIRVVLAITSEAKTAAGCHSEIDAKVASLKKAWQKLQITPDDIIVDFIAVLPRYEWAFEQEGNREAAVERLAGFRMQTNIHLSVKTEATAQLAVAEAFGLEITDIIAFDYWSDALDEAKVQARDRALQEARAKTEQLLVGLVDDAPRVINIQEQTVVLHPDSFYESFSNSYEQTLERPVRRDLPMVRAYRPRNTYYRGPQVNVDVQSKRMPMEPEISVVSRVRIYLESPAAKHLEAKSAGDAAE